MQSDEAESYSDMDCTDTDEEHANWVAERRQEIEAHADSDAPDAWVYERLLESLADEDGGAS